MSSDIKFDDCEFPPLSLAVRNNHHTKIVSSSSQDSGSCEEARCNRAKRKHRNRSTNGKLANVQITSHKRSPSFGCNDHGDTGGSNGNDLAGGYDDELAYEDIGPGLGLDAKPISDGYSFVRGRVGIKINNFNDNFHQVLKENRIGQPNCGSDFILTHIQPARQIFYYNDKFEAIADLCLPTELWNTRVAINLGLPLFHEFNLASIKDFQRLFNHALYLGSPTILITCPSSDLGIVTLASMINDSLSNTATKTLVLFRVDVQKKSSSGQIRNNSAAPPTSQYQDTTSDSQKYSCDGSKDEPRCAWNDDWTPQSEDESSNSNREDHLQPDPWKLWNDLRSHLNPDPRIGVCLSINEDLPCSEKERLKWCGEPVRMIIINTDQFVLSYSNSEKSVPRLNIRLKEFFTKIALTNSLMTCFVLDSPLEPRQLRPYTEYLKKLYQEIQDENPDPLRRWNDFLQPPLQPLSSNLTSGIYSVFEMDIMKYLKYRDAMIEALQRVIYNDKPAREKIILMVLGAGRGPLVDNFIDAIRSFRTDYKFKIYALDKNESSIRSLRYKQQFMWASDTDTFETEVVESDMRNWNPGVKADIIATELLGSLADNELSPECIDGLWQVSTPETISIPCSYSSYIAPICSHKLHQDLCRLREPEQHVFDQLHVVKLTNHYLIDDVQELFHFEHNNLAEPPEKRCNQRYRKLVFKSKVDTVCHGFAGYFSAHLFGKVSISTCPDNKTKKMDSWFPMFIPLEEAIHLTRDTELEVHFWRKESNTKVWYQWVVTKPVRTRIYSPGGRSTAMSKFT